MNGFGKDLKKRTEVGRIFHSCSLEGLSELIQNHTPTTTCFSTFSSKRLFGREVVVVLKRGAYSGLHTPFDADAGKSFGYDEFRVVFETWDDLASCIEYIVCDDSVYKYVEGDYVEDYADEDGEVDEEEKEKHEWYFHNVFEDLPCVDADFMEAELGFHKEFWNFD